MNTISNSQARRQEEHLYYAGPPTTSSHSCCKACCCCLLLLLCFLALLVLAGLLVIVLAVKPRRPHLDLTQVGLQYMATAPDPNQPGPGAAKLYLIIRLALAMVNPNRVGISCRESSLTLVYRATPLATTTLPAFCQHPHTVKNMVATVAVDDINLSNTDTADFTRDALLNDRIELRLLAHLATNIHLLNLPSPPIQVSMNCVIVISPRKQSLTYKQCGLENMNV